MEQREGFLINRIKSIGFAFKGAFLLVKTEASIQIQFVIAIIMTLAGFYWNLSATEWALQCLAIGLVMAIEGLNTTVEKLSDFVHPQKHSKIGFIKDISAGAVFIAAVTAIVVGFIIYYPKLF
ncbi:diacylglycerol kinase [Mangrovimonas aestuarii]|uniref:diacylglycerol kinase n=1 Tax=Mangrovimonas aestuarii TaxID=3018443 RepID=UPI0023798259|nr:diacylglycerol kinase family protein [Mangrovimonas aestuarii]